MGATIFNEVKSREIETAVMEVFDCKISEIVGFSDKISKKVVVFILFKLLDFDKRLIGANYNMSYLYVPTASNEVETLFLTDYEFRKKVCCVINIIGYESKVAI